MKYRQGFTLFELLIVISIIGILMAVASVSFSAAQKKARDARRKEDMNAVQIAAETFYSIQNFAYPVNTASPWVATLGGGDTILAVYPTDPKPAPHTQYTYTYTAATNTYCACAYLESLGSGNSNGSCNFLAATKNYYCVKNKQ